MAKLDGGPAFPSGKINIESSWADFPYLGLSLRDYFAAQALPQAIQYERDIRCASSGLIWDGTKWIVREAVAASYESRLKAIAQAAYAIADAMLSEREE